MVNYPAGVQRRAAMRWRFGGAAIIVVFMTLFVQLGVAQAQTCIDDVTDRTNNCTANDVNLGILINNEDISCTPGTDVTLELTALLNATSAERWDIGLFIAADGGNARTGFCARDYLQPVSSNNSDYFPGTGINDPGGPFYNAEIDDVGDMCADLEQGVDTYYALAQQVTVPCVDTDGDGLLDIGSCVSWDNSASTGTPSKPSCTGLDDTVPSTKAKCRCESVTVGNVSVEPGTLRVTKTASPDSVDEPGGNVSFTFTIENTSNPFVDITINSLTDSQFGDLTDLVANPGTTCSTPILLDQPSESYSCTVTAYVTTPDGQPGVHQNTVTVVGSDGNGNDVQGSATEEVIVTDALPVVTLTKTANQSELPEPGGDFVFTLEIVNQTNETVTITELLDSQSSDAVDFSACTALVTNELVANSSTSCQYTVAHSEAGTYENTASVTIQDDDGNSASANDSETVVVTNEPPTVALSKTADPTNRPEPGGDFTYTLEITNTSDEPVTIVALTDSQSSEAVDFSACSSLLNVSLQPDASVTCIYTVERIEAGQYDNTASVTVEDNEETSASAEASESVTVANALPAVILTKSVTPPSRPEPGGPFVYTLEITNDSVEPVTITGLIDSQSADAVDFTLCAGLIGATLQPGGKTSCEYTVNHTNAGQYDNAAQVTVVDNEGSSAGDEASASATVVGVDPQVTIVKVGIPASRPEPGGEFDFTLTITNDSVEPVTITSLTDDQSSAVDFSQCAALVGTTLLPGQSRTCTYSIIHLDAGQYENTAVVTVQDDEGVTATDQESETVTVVDVLPTVTLTKNASPLSRPEPGGEFTFTLEITNNSVENVEITALADIQSSETDFSACTALVGESLAPNETVSCQYTILHVDSGTYPNSAAVSVQDNEGNPAGDIDEASVTVTNALPVVTVTKAAVPQSRPEPGGEFVYTVEITNSSVEPVTITALSDTQSAVTDFSACTALVGTELQPGDTVSCNYQITQTESGEYPNTVSVTVEDNEGTSDTDTDEELITVTDLLPVVSLVKTAEPQSRVEPGGDFDFTLEIINQSIEPVTITALGDTQADDALDFSACAALVGQVLPPGQGVTCVYTVNHTDAGQYDNRATVAVEDNEGNEAQTGDEASVSVIGVDPQVTISKTATPQNRPEPGGDFVYTLEITNNSVEPVTITALSDSQSNLTLDFSACIALIGQVLQPNEVVACEYTVVQTEAGEYPNSAAVTAEDNEGASVTDNANESVTVTDLLPAVTLVKSVVPESLPEPGGDFTYTLAITNESVEAVTITSLNDTQSAAVSDFSDCAGLIGMTLEPGQTRTCQYVFTRTAIGQYDNVARVSVEDNEGNSAADSDDAVVTVIELPASLAIAKRLVGNDDADGSESVTVGDTLTYEITVSNNGQVTLVDVVIADPMLPNLQCNWPSTPGVLVPEEAVTCTGLYVVVQADVDRGRIRNTATADSGRTEPVSDIEVVNVPQNPLLTVEKELVGNADEDGSGSVTVNDTLSYRIKVRNSGNVTLADVTVEDTLIDTLACSPEPPVDLAPAEEIICTGTYVVGQSDVAAGSVRNTALAQGETPTGTVVEDDDVEENIVETPTAISLVTFYAASYRDRIDIVWKTDFELNTFGYNLYRSDKPDFATSVKLNSSIIPAFGASGGEYLYQDTDVIYDTRYYYWLIEIEGGNQSLPYGPVNALAGLNSNNLPNRSFMPLISR